MARVRARGLAAVSRFRLPRTLLARTLSLVSEAGRRGDERFVLWGGRPNGDRTVFEFSSLVVPDQQPIRTTDGLMVLIGDEALFDVNRELHRRDEILGGQLHGHPNEDIRHSQTDNELAVVTVAGGLSVIAPHFAHTAATAAKLAWYRLAENGSWNQIDPANLVEVTE